MRRTAALLIAFAMASAYVVAAPSAATADGAQVLKMSIGCNVGWDEESGDTSEGAIAACDIVNVKTAQGDYRLVLHGQIPPEWIDEFIADGSPRTFAPGCLVNWGFVYTSNFTIPLVFTDSVRHFTPDGAMTEVCSPSQ